VGGCSTVGKGGHGTGQPPDAAGGGSPNTTPQAAPQATPQGPQEAPGSVEKGGITSGGTGAIGGEILEASAIQTDGKVLAVHQLFSKLQVQRFDHETLDPGFGNAGSADLNLTDAQKLLLQADGKIVVLGIQAASGGSQTQVLMRLNTDGSLDKAFGNAGTVRLADFDATFDFGPATAAMGADGEVVVAGSIAAATDAALHAKFIVEKIKDDGTKDSSFGNGGFADTGLTATSPINIHTRLNLLPDGSIRVGCVTANPPGTPESFFNVFSFNSEGHLDTSFGGLGGMEINLLKSSSAAATDAFYYPGAEMVSLENGTLLLMVPTMDVSGTYDGSGPIDLARLNPDGSWDDSFGDHGIVKAAVHNFYANMLSLSYQVLLQADQKLVLLGRVTSDPSGSEGGNSIAIARFNTDGTKDQAFGSDGVASVALPLGSPHDGNPIGISISTSGDLIVTGGTSTAVPGDGSTASDGGLVFAPFIQWFSSSGTPEK
jgi:uncharacterized delta-60 repeat protein